MTTGPVNWPLLIRLSTSPSTAGSVSVAASISGVSWWRTRLA
ncbi:hypothetical protein O7606_07885 [Micromonospora sp. WMMD882]|nr:hypothetical protein [Micromonospora sp. WMMD882]WBB82589.1 hypothetical protein O7606_07885 [Micromonospora sp. WMMD882]